MIARILAAVVTVISTRLLSRGMDPNHLHFYGLVGGAIAMAILLMRPEAEPKPGADDDAG